MEGYSVFGNGLLYNWYAVEGRDSNNVLHRFAPVGWHVPTDAEFTTLTNALGGASVAGGKMKSTRTNAPYFQPTNVGATDESGFRGFGAGTISVTGSFFRIYTYSYMWSITQVSANNSYVYILQNSEISIVSVSSSKKSGMSIRLLKDDSNWYPGMILTDIDGNKYPTIKIGNQVWLQSNWKCTKYADGVPIAYNLSAYTDKFSASEWQNLTYGGYCSYDNVAIVEYTTPNQYKKATKHFIDVRNVADDNGLLYNWYAVNGDSEIGSKVFAPSGWHVPTQADFNTLVTYLGGSNVAGGKMKSIRTDLQPGWNSPNTGATDICGFRWFGSGQRGANGSFTAILNNGFIWTATAYDASYSWNFYSYYNKGGTSSSRAYANKCGFSVRLIKDDSNWYPGMVVTDLDGNKYATVKIGNQVLLKSNWKCTKYNDGTPIPNVTNGTTWAGLTTGAYCSYDNLPIKSVYDLSKKSTLRLSEDFKNNPTGTNLTPYGWNKGTGVYKVSKLTSDITSGTLKLPKNTHYLECVTAGTLAIPSSTAFGTWEFKVYKGADNNVIDTLITSSMIGVVTASIQNGYLIRFGSDEKIYLYKTTNGTLSSALITSSTLNNTTWYKVKITRTVAGLFTMYINDVSINTATDTSFTTSNFMILDHDVSDRMTDIKIYDGIIV